MAKKNKSETRPNTAEIAALAYRIYLEEGAPHGRDTEHWLHAEILLKERSKEENKSPKDARL